MGIFPWIKKISDKSTKLLKKTSENIKMTKDIDILITKLTDHAKTVKIIKKKRKITKI